MKMDNQSGDQDIFVGGGWERGRGGGGGAGVAM